LTLTLHHCMELKNRALKQAVKRNIHRFPSDFMFVLSANEVNQMVSQNVIPSKSHFGGSFPFAFTEHGVAMLSSILKSKKAVEINISIVRAFIMIRQYALSHKDLTEKLKELETKYNMQFKDVYEALTYLLQKDKLRKQEKDSFAKREKIGFKISK
jgi:hypothetical protein